MIGGKLFDQTCLTTQSIWHKGYPPIIIRFGLFGENSNLLIAV